MHRGFLAAVLLLACQAHAWAGPFRVAPEHAAFAVANPAGEHATVPAIIDRIRSKLANAGLHSNSDPADLAALEAFYGNSSATPLWITDMGLSARGQSALFEIERADDWGLDAAAFELPLAFNLPRSADEEAIAEIKLDLAILKYARFARGGRLNPRELSAVFDQAPTLQDPKKVLMEIAAARSPDAYLQSLHPKHEQFVRLREALLRLRGSVDPLWKVLKCSFIVGRTDLFGFAAHLADSSLRFFGTLLPFVFVETIVVISAEKTGVGSVAVPTCVLSAKIAFPSLTT